MAYPFAGFGSFLFRQDERPLDDSDTEWIASPTVQRSRALGTANDRLQTMSIGSLDRSFEMMFEPDRYSTIFAMINTTDTFTDWRRPAPDSRNARLANVRFIRNVGVLCSDGVTRRKVRALVSLISQ